MTGFRIVALVEHQPSWVRVLACFKIRACHCFGGLAPWARSPRMHNVIGAALRLWQACCHWPTHACGWHHTTTWLGIGQPRPAVGRLPLRHACHAWVAARSMHATLMLSGHAWDRAMTMVRITLPQWCPLYPSTHLPCNVFGRMPLPTHQGRLAQSC
jgi:hypothetical protein